MVATKPLQTLGGKAGVFITQGRKFGCYLTSTDSWRKCRVFIIQGHKDKSLLNLYRLCKGNTGSLLFRDSLGWLVEFQQEVQQKLFCCQKKLLLNFRLELKKLRDEVSLLFKATRITSFLNLEGDTDVLTIQGHKDRSLLNLYRLWEGT